jgi:hypothetical protein
MRIIMCRIENCISVAGGSLLGFMATAESEATGQKQHRRHDQLVQSDEQDEYTSGLVEVVDVHALSRLVAVDDGGVHQSSHAPRHRRRKTN